MLVESPVVLSVCSSTDYLTRGDKTVGFHPRCYFGIGLVSLPFNMHIIHEYPDFKGVFTLGIFWGPSAIVPSASRLVSIDFIEP